jgi:hypothetical protein
MSVTQHGSGTTPTPREAYVYWAKRLVLCHDRGHAPEMGETQISKFLAYCSVQDNVAAST